MTLIKSQNPKQYCSTICNTCVCMQDTAWLDIYLSDIPHVVYQVDDWDKTEGAEHRTLVNKGNEAMAYLQFILDYWGRLPASMVFLHGHRCVSWFLLPCMHCRVHRHSSLSSVRSMDIRCLCCRIADALRY